MSFDNDEGGTDMGVGLFMSGKAFGIPFGLIPLESWYFSNAPFWANWFLDEGGTAYFGTPDF